MNTKQNIKPRIKHVPAVDPHRAAVYDLVSCYECRPFATDSVPGSARTVEGSSWMLATQYEDGTLIIWTKAERKARRPFYGLMYYGVPESIVDDIHRPESIISEPDDKEPSFRESMKSRGRMNRRWPHDQ